MKNIFIVLIISSVLLSGCNANVVKNSTDSSTDATIATDNQRYYTLDEFDWVEIDKTTRDEVIKYLGGGELQLTSYGSSCELPTLDGDTIVIKFSMPPEETVWDISIEGVQD